MGLFFQERKTRWEVLGGNNNVGRAEDPRTFSMHTLAWNRLMRHAARLCYPFLHALSPVLLVLEKRDPWPTVMAYSLKSCYPGGGFSRPRTYEPAEYML